MKNKNLILAISLLGIGFAKAAIAEDNLDSRVYVAPSLSYVWADSDRQSSRSANGFSLAVGKALDQDFNLELKGFYNGLAGKSSKANHQNDWDIFGTTVDLQYHFNRNIISPYTVIAAGVSESRFGRKSSIGLVGEAGFGADYKINDSLSLRSDVRYRYNNNSQSLSNINTYNDAVVNVGIIVPLGYAPTIKAESSQSESPQGKNSSEVLKRINFGFDSAALNSGSKDALDEVIKQIITDSKKVEIQGHASSEGDATFNQNLSQTRAKSVANYLVKKGIAKDKISAKGYGSKMPIANNKTKEGRAKNRRVDIILK